MVTDDCVYQGRGRLIRHCLTSGPPWPRAITGIVGSKYINSKTRHGCELWRPKTVGLKYLFIWGSAKTFCLFGDQTQACQNFKSAVFVEVSNQYIRNQQRLWPLSPLRCPAGERWAENKTVSKYLSTPRYFGRSVYSFNRGGITWVSLS